jgi:hypothetical protein
MGWSPGHWSYMSAAPSPTTEASVTTLKGLLKAGYGKSGSSVSPCFSPSNARCCLSPHSHGTALLNSVVSGTAFEPKSAMNRRYNPAK